VVADLEPEAIRHRRLPLLDATVNELLDLAAVKTHDMVVVSTLVQLENGHPVLEMMSGDEAGSLELREHAVHRREADVLVGLEQLLVNRFRTLVPRRAILENLEDLETGQGHLEAGLAQIFAFQIKRSRL